MSDIKLYARNPKALAQKLLFDRVEGLVEANLQDGRNPTEIAEELLYLIERLDAYMRDNADPLDRDKFQADIRKKLDKALAFKGLPCVELRGQKTLYPEFPD